MSPEPAGADVESALHAIGHAGRRAMLRLASDGERTSSELAQIAGLSPSAASQHLKVLREAGLMHVRVDATRRLYRVDLQRLAQVRAFLDDFWGEQLAALATTAEMTHRQQKRRKPA